MASSGRALDLLTQAPPCSFVFIQEFPAPRPGWWRCHDDVLLRHSLSLQGAPSLFPPRSPHPSPLQPICFKQMHLRAALDAKVSAWPAAEPRSLDPEPTAGRGCGSGSSRASQEEMVVTAQGSLCSLICFLLNSLRDSNPKGSLILQRLCLVIY